MKEILFKAKRLKTNEKVADWRCNINEEDSLEILIEVEE